VGGGGGALQFFDTERGEKEFGRILGKQTIGGGALNIVKLEWVLSFNACDRKEREGRRCTCIFICSAVEKEGAVPMRVGRRRTVTIYNLMSLHRKKKMRSKRTFRGVAEGPFPTYQVGRDFWENRLAI